MKKIDGSTFEDLNFSRRFPWMFPKILTYSSCD